jgi:peptidyl-prolyl cis-trans isomerase SurA
MSGRGLGIAIWAGRMSLTSVAVALAMCAGLGRAQTPAHGPVPAVPPDKAAPGAGPLGEEISLDRVVAIVNNDLILESDVYAEERFAVFQPFAAPGPVSRDKLIERLIDRALIFQQMALQPSPPITDAEVDAELDTLRKTLPKCAAYHCETDAGWKKFVEDQGFTLDELRDRWRQRMELLRFIEERFRMGIRILPSDIDEYYNKTMVPAYQKENAQAPPEATISDRIQEIVLQQRVNTLLDDWLTALRAQGSVRILKPGEEAP